MTEPDSSASPFSRRTAWARQLETPLRRFLRTETGSAAVLLAATLVALAWANIDASGYAAFWETELSIRVGSAGLAADLQEWVNSGLMTFFFLVAGLEARREFDMGELRERRRLTLPLLVGLGGMVVPIGIYLAVNAGQASAQGWGTAMSTDTAFALGMLALVGSGVPDRVSTYLLTFAIVDDVVALVIIALAYSGHIDPLALGVGLAILAVAVAGRARGIRFGPAYFLVGVAAWIAFFKSGVDPLVVGLVMGVLALAYPAARGDLEQASESFRLFREQPTPELAATAQGERALGAFAERPAAAAVPPLDELPDRAVVRPGQRRDPDQRELPGPGFHLAGHARDPARLRRREAGRHRGHGLAASPGSAAAGSSRRSAGRRSPARARSRASGSPCPC